MFANRKRPPLDLIDFVGFSTSALVHAGDDRSAMETLEAVPAREAKAVTPATRRNPGAAKNPKEPETMAVAARPVPAATPAHRAPRDLSRSLRLPWTNGKRLSPRPICYRPR